MSHGPRPLTERDIETLNELHGCLNTGLAWARPLDCGGSDSSHHSATLAKLVKRGFAKRERRSWTPGRRGSWGYQVTAAGVACLDRKRRA